jgi:uncharacterized integral membrane protein (TIGR00697 family)
MSNQRWVPVVAAVFVTCLIVSNIIAVKLVAIGPFYLPAAIVIFPVAYIFGDILTEVYGYARARQVIWLGFACNLLAVAAIWIGGQLPAAPFWVAGVYETPQEAEQAYAAILGSTSRLLGASFVAYLFGEFLNSFVLAKMKIATRGRMLWTRTIGSTLVGQLADSGVFILLAFAGTVPSNTLGNLILTQWLVKSVYETLATPLTYGVVNYLKRVENQDHYDYDTNFNPLALTE